MPGWRLSNKATPIVNMSERGLVAGFGGFETAEMVGRCPFAGVKQTPQMDGSCEFFAVWPSTVVPRCDRVNAEKRFASALWNFLIYLNVEDPTTSANSANMEKANDQIDRFCCLCLSCRNFSTGNDSCAASRAGRRYHASRLRLRSVQNTSCWSLRRQDDHPPCAPRSSQVRAMAWRRLRSVGLLTRLTTSRLLFLRSGSAHRQAERSGQNEIREQLGDRRRSSRAPLVATNERDLNQNNGARCGNRGEDVLPEAVMPEIVHGRA
jgi:hypothetical protein